jgi:transposase
MTSPDTSPAALLALDWADQKHDFALLVEGSSQPECGQLQHEAGQIQEFVTGLRCRFGGRPVAVIVEQSRGALIHALLGHDHLWLYPVNPVALARFRATFAPSGAKDDPTDALLLLELLAKHRDRLHRWLPDDSQTRTLALLVEERRRAVDERTRLVEQLLACLKGYYPQAIALLDGQLGTALACKFLLKWPEFQALARARRDTIRRLFYANHFRRIDRLEQRLEAQAGTTPLTTDLAVIAAGRARCTRLATQIQALLPHIKGCEKRIAELFAAHPDAPIFASLPGAGPALAPRLLAAFGSQRERWSDAGQLATFAGVAPVIKRSGKQSTTHFRHAAPKFLRQSFHEFANCSRRFCPWAADFYRAKCQSGHGHHCAVRALAFKWIRIIHACWIQGTPYDPQRYRPGPSPHSAA